MATETEIKITEGSYDGIITWAAGYQRGRAEALAEAAERLRREADGYDHDDEDGQQEHSPACPRCRFASTAIALDRLASSGATPASGDKGESDGS